MKAKTKAKTTTKTPDTNNHYYKLLEKKFHSSDIVRSQIAEIKERVKKTVIEEPLKSLSVSFKGEVVGNSFEKTLKIISKHVFHKGKIDSYKTVKENGVVICKYYGHTNRSRRTDSISHETAFSIAL